MVSKYFVLCLAALVSVTTARVIRDVPNPEPDSVTSFVENLGKLIKDTQDKFFKTFSMDDVNQIQEKTLEQGKEFASKIDAWANHLKEETEALKDNQYVKELRQSIDKEIEDFKAKHPKTADELKEYVEKVSKGTEEIIGKIENVKNSDEAKNIQDLSQKLLDSTAATLTNIANQLKESMKQ